MGNTSLTCEELMQVLEDLHLFMDYEDPQSASPNAHVLGPFTASVPNMTGKGCPNPYVQLRRDEELPLGQVLPCPLLRSMAHRNLNTCSNLSTSFNCFY